VVAQYTVGSWLERKIRLYPGNGANDDINNRGLGKKSDVKGFRPLGIDGNHIFGDWFEISAPEVDALGSLTFMRPGKLGTFDRFGWMVVGER
jgi:hypothetical protein